MATDQNHSSNSSEIRALKKQLEDYHSEHNTLERRVKGLERYVRSLETELEDLDECVDRETVVDLIQEIVPSLIGKKGPKGCKGLSYSSESSEESDSVEIIEESPRYQVREVVPHKQQRKGVLRSRKGPSRTYLFFIFEYSMP